jgi:hypothetical protein
MKPYPKIKSVEALPSKKLRVTFESGHVRIYDCRPLLKEEPFQDSLLLGRIGGTSAPSFYYPKFLLLSS